MRKLFKKSAVIMAMILVFTSLCGYVYSTDHPKVYDDADLFTDEEEEMLEEMAIKYGEAVRLDLIVYTIDENQNKSVMQIADDFYDYNYFGYDDCDGSGAILLIDMYHRELWMTTAGLAQAYIDENTEDDILDEIQSWVKSGDYYEAAEAFIMGVNEAGEDFIGDSDNDKLLEEWYAGEYSEYDDIAEQLKPNFFTKFENPLLCLGIGLVAALIVVGIMLIRSKTRMTVGSRTYLRNGSLNFPVRNDVFIRTTTTKRVIQSNSGGSGGGSRSHRSSSGRSHGGGGRSF